MNRIKDLVFDKSYDGKFDCFTGRYDNQFMCGSNESGKFRIGNYENFNQISIIEIQCKIEERFLKLNNKGVTINE